MGSAFTAAIGTTIGVHHLWFPLLFSGNYFVHNCLHSPDGSGRTLTLQTRDREVFAALFLDNQHRILAYEELFLGTLSAATVYPRDVVKRALHYNAAALILVHNHPSGYPEPSRADIEITLRLQDALALVDIRILDHLVVGTEGIVSLAERGNL
ncbi:RadC family protein [Aeromonas media]|uniref:RadC family protein n=1 Tax=Aeromonas media TaxID=651 RepID=UPI0039EB2375